MRLTFIRICATFLLLCTVVQKESAMKTPAVDSFPKSIRDVYVLSDRTRKRNKERKQQKEGGEGEGEGGEPMDAEYVVCS